VLNDLRFAVGNSQVAGALTVEADGLMQGNLSVVSPDLSRVAPLFLMEARGALRAEVALAEENGAQSATFSGTASDIVYGGASLKSAAIDGRAGDLFRAPQIEGDFSLTDLRAGGLTIVGAKGTATRLGEATSFVVDATLADGRADLKGSLTPAEGVVSVGLESLRYQRPGIDLALAEPTTIAVRDAVANFDRATLRAGGGSIVVTGSAGSMLDLEVVLGSVPAALVNAFSPGLGAEGTVSGVVSARGRASAPDANFEITLAGASVAASRNAGLGALGVSARGTLVNEHVELTSEVFGAEGISVQVSGAVGTALGAPLDLQVSGSVPLALGNRQLASRGAALQGALDIDVAVSGTAAAPKFSGRVTSEGGGFVDPGTGIVLRNLALVANVSGDRVAIERLTAQSGEGGVSATGSVGLDPNSGFPLDLKLEIRDARYVDGTLVAARFDADLTLSGSLAAGPLLSGRVTLDRTEITIPERLPKDSVAVDVAHVAAPRNVEETLAILHAREEAGRGGASGARADIRLDVAVFAPQRIFVRGRGLDTEFGGNLVLRGSISALSASGAFQMGRGRLDILTQRIAFDRGVITFAGDLDPVLDFSGSTRSGDVTITVTVSGRASDPEVIFSSTPELPQDEILARLIFQKGIGELSPLQVARLAAAASELSGGSGGLLSKLRATTGLDELDVVIDEEGQASVAAGRYVTENVYVGVEQGTTAESSRVTIDLDVTDNVKARAGMSAEGESSLGIYFEREY
jgi:translocation and assembly module TamB